VPKYADHLLLYRRAQIYAPHWRTASVMLPGTTGRCMSATDQARLFADGTTAPVLDPGRGSTKTGQLWAYAADDRPWGGSDPPGVVYAADYATDTSAGWAIDGREANSTRLRPLSLARYSASSAREINVSAVSPYTY
jgi:hypothetical protein